MKHDYACLACGEKFELEYPIGYGTKDGKHEGAKCSKCGSGNVKKLIITTPSIIYNGGGWGGKQDK